MSNKRMKMMLVKSSTHTMLKEIKEKEGGKNYPEIMDEIVRGAYKNYFFAQNANQQFAMMQTEQTVKGAVQ